MCREEAFHVRFWLTSYKSRRKTCFFPTSCFLLPNFRELLSVV